MKKTVVFVLGLLIFCLAVPPAHSGHCSAAYETYLKHKIVSCLNKSRMLINSESSNLQQYAAFNLQKASYFISAKSSILEDLNSKEGCLKPHQIDVYLNERFSRMSKENLIAGR